MKLQQGIVLSALITGLAICPTARADTWNFTGNGGAGSVGNSMSFNSLPAGVTVTVTAWYVNGGNLLQKAALGQYSGGLGICSGSETCSSPEHQVDNKGQLEFALFQFSQPLENLSFTVNPSPDSDPAYSGGTPDRDVSFWAGNNSFGANLLTNQNFGTIGSLFTAGSGDIMNSDSGSAATVNLTTSGPVTSVLFGSLDTVNSDDFFKISGMSATRGTGIPTSAVPEPTSVVLLSTVVAGVAVALRRKLQPAVVVVEDQQS